MNNHIGTVIKSLRKEGGFNQLEFAKLIGISRSFLSEVETGGKNPSVELLKVISMKTSIPLPLLYLRALNEEDYELEIANSEEIIDEIKSSIEKINSLFSVKKELVESSY